MKATHIKFLATLLLLASAGFTAQAQAVSQSRARSKARVQMTPKGQSRVTNATKRNAVKANTSTRKAAKPTTAMASPYSINGSINHDTWDKNQSSTITFQRFPATLDEFKQAREALGREPQGAVALQVMAFELYRRDKQAGTAALELVNTATNHKQTLRQLSEVMGKDPNYSRHYLAAALLQGARPNNAYTPNTPYSIAVRVNPVSAYQESEMLHGTVIYLQVESAGWDTPWRGVEVVKPEGSDYYVVSNCPALYTQCKQIKGKWTPLK